MKDQEYLDKFEDTIHKSIYNYLRKRDVVDHMLPDAPDIEDKWESICMSYLQDGVREFNGYPTVSLGWMMFIGMAVARMWDEDWEKHSKHEDIYTLLRDVRGYDNLDEHICETVLGLDEKEAQKTSDLVADTASMVHRTLMREGFEPGTPTAFNAYVRCLHQLYYYGAAVELKRLGYHMTEVSHSDLWGKISMN